VIRWPLVRQRRWLASTLYIMSSTLINRLVRLPPIVPLARSETDTAQKKWRPVGALLLGTFAVGFQVYTVWNYNQAMNGMSPEEEARYHQRMARRMQEQEEAAAQQNATAIGS
jgi:hypothetical protein